MSAVYAESSAILRWLLQHQSGARIGDALAAAPAVVTSRLTTLEVARTLQRLTGTRQIAPAERASCWATYQRTIQHWKTYAVVEEILERAGEPFPVEPVRALDAIHLATAIIYGKAVGPLSVLSSDERVRDNAGALGFQILP